MLKTQVVDRVSRVDALGLVPKRILLYGIGSVAPQKVEWKSAGGGRLDHCKRRLLVAFGLSRRRDQVPPSGTWGWQNEPLSVRLATATASSDKSVLAVCSGNQKNPRPWCWQ